MLRLIPEYPPVIIGAHPPRCLPAAGRQGAWDAATVCRFRHSSSPILLPQARLLVAAFPELAGFGRVFRRCARARLDEGDLGLGQVVEAVDEFVDSIFYIRIMFITRILFW